MSGCGMRQSELGKRNVPSAKSTDGCSGLTCAATAGLNAALKNNAIATTRFAARMVGLRLYARGGSCTKDYGRARSTGGPSHVSRSATSVTHNLHCCSNFLVADGEVGHLQPAPPGLFLCDRQALGRTHDLAHTRMTKQVWVYGSRLARLSVPRGAQGQD